MGHHDDAGSTGTNKSCVDWQRSVRQGGLTMRPATSPCALVSRCFDTAMMLGAYIFDCAKHRAVFGSSELGSEDARGTVVR
jgi:hypothetical protein